MYLFFDTETAGLPRNKKTPISNLKNWPRLVQMDINGRLWQNFILHYFMLKSAFMT